MTDSIFTKIINREIPANIIYEDDLVIAFLDINPINKGHLLIVPKQWFKNVFDGEAEVLAQMMRVGQKLALAIKKSLGADGVNLLMNNGEAAGQEVPHSHLHVIPRYEGDNSYGPVAHQEYEAGEMKTTATKIKTALTD